ncbi:IclR family transcriptional regulator [Streptomyces coffeae]|uniref:IclR family transcriptional regulator n=1 Tax=Streptomyces coffeae TaxID=621382 RepID=A0ABS1NKH6_9ACTN|nr:IclR family transcriptional regulator [Streptomyces coffeae]MBL1100565.1 IclR family transcriptional regulator [Streptomyces coffeae]
MANAKPDARPVVPALDRAIRLLRLLGETPQRAYTMAEIARALEVPRSSAFNLCSALAEGQLIRRTRDGFQLGRGLLELGSAYVSSVNLVAEFYDVARKVPLDLGATVQLAVLDDDLQAVYLAYQDCGSGLRLGLAGSIGRRVPANCSACGKILLALLPPAELDRRLTDRPTLPRLTQKSVTSRAHLMREICAARDSDHAMDEEEAVPGLSCVASGFATSHADGGYVAVSITTAMDTLDDQKRRTVITTLDSLVGELKARL